MISIGNGAQVGTVTPVKVIPQGRTCECWSRKETSSIQFLVMFQDTFEALQGKSVFNFLSTCPPRIMGFGSSQQFLSILYRRFFEKKVVRQGQRQRRERQGGGLTKSRPPPEERRTGEGLGISAESS